ncbi:MAG: hypothetical protein II115_04650, partial [Prevotella sp.]|nr:hypothetical protein [Prevotella sp.]
TRTYADDESFSPWECGVARIAHLSSMLSTHSTASAAQTSAKTILVFWMFVISSAKIMLFSEK